MKKILALILSIILILSLFSACGTGENLPSEGDSETSLPEAEEENNTLIISSPLKTQEGLGLAALTKGFMERYPDKTIILQDGDIDPYTVTGEELIVAQNSYIEKLKTGITAGEAPDLIYDATGYVETFAYSGLLKDMNELIDSDPDFNRSDYFENVLSAYEHADGLYLFPTVLSYNIVRLRQDVAELAGLDFEETLGFNQTFAYSLYYSLLETNDIPDIRTIGREARQNRGIFTMEEYASAFDRENFEFNFDTPEFISFLNNGNSYTLAKPYIFGDFIMHDDAGERLFDTEGYFVEGYYTYLSNISIFLEENENASDLLPIMSSKNETMISALCMSIPENAENPELAWEFIKYCIEESDEVSKDMGSAGQWNGDRFDARLPINKANFEKFVPLFFTGFEDSYIEKITSQLRAPLEGAVTAPLSFNALTPALNEIRQEFYDGLISAQECVTRMQERADMFVLENK